MAEYELQEFMEGVKSAVATSPVPADCVFAIAPLMHRLISGKRRFLLPRHFRSAPDRYARNAIHVAPDGGPSLYALVWNPGQWTPVHDHGTWGVVGVVRGVLEERSFARLTHDESDRGIRLQRGSVILLGEGSITTFVPNPDHIHRTGVPQDRGQAVSLHLYGRILDSFHVYDVAAGTRKRVEVRHNGG